MEMYGSEEVKYGVPLAHIDYAYLEKCNDAAEIEKILKILRSGEVGGYPDLESFAEKRLTALKPTSKLLRKPDRLHTPGDLDKEEWNEIDEDLKKWMNDIKLSETTLAATSDLSMLRGEDEDEDDAEDDHLPPVRGSKATIPLGKLTVDGDSSKSGGGTKRVKPRDYREWDKLDVEEELRKVEEGENDGKSKTVFNSTSKTPISETVKVSQDVSNAERKINAEREKDKGNESFRVGDLDEAVVYYTRSLGWLQTPAAFNNRAQTYLKLKSWNKAVDDCNQVLKLEPDNLKAILRRAVAYQGLSRYINAKQDVEIVLVKEPTNKQAMELLKSIEKSLADQKVTGRRLVIEEDDEDEDEDDSKMTSRGRDKEEAEKMDEKKLACPETPPTVNGLETGEKNISVLKTDNSVAPPCESGTHPCKSTPCEPSRNPCESAPHPLESASRPCESDGSSAAKERLAESNAPGGVAKSDAGSGEPAQTGLSGGTPSQVNAELSTTATTPIANIHCSLPHSASIASLGQLDVELPPPPPLSPAVAVLKDAGNSLFKTGQYSEALEKYNKAINLLEGETLQAANLAVLYSNRSACRMKTGDCRGCIEDCDQALKISPPSPSSSKPLLRRAAAYETLEKYREAFVDYRSVLNLGVSSDVAQKGADRCSAVLTEIDGRNWRDKLPKIPSFSSLSSLLPPSFSPSTTAPSPDLTRKQPAKAAEPSPDDLFEKYKAEGNTLFGKGDWLAAIDSFTRCIQLYPDRVVPYTNRALCYLRLNQCDKVLDDCNQALGLEFHNVKALFRRAQAYKIQERWDESVVDLETLLKIDPNNSAARKELAAVVQAKEDEQEKRAHAACMREKKMRHRVPIQEMEESSDEEEDGDAAEVKVKTANSLHLPPHSSIIS